MRSLFSNGCYHSAPETLALGGFLHCTMRLHRLLPFQNAARVPQSPYGFHLKCANSFTATNRTCIVSCSPLKARLSRSFTSVTAGENLSQIVDRSDRLIHLRSASGAVPTSRPRVLAALLLALPAAAAA